MTDILKTRFPENAARHPDLSRKLAEARLCAGMTGAAGRSGL